MFGIASIEKNMTKLNNRNYKYPVGDQKIIKKLSGSKYKRGNIALPKRAEMLEKVKYNFCQSILAYQQNNNLSLTSLANELSLPKKIVYDICRGKINAVCLKHLVIYAKKLGITFVLCPNCGGNFLGSRDRQLATTLKKYEELLPETQIINQALENYRATI